MEQGKGCMWKVAVTLSVQWLFVTLLPWKQHLSRKWQQCSSCCLMMVILCCYHILHMTPIWQYSIIYNISPSLWTAWRHKTTETWFSSTVTWSQPHLTFISADKDWEPSTESLNCQNVVCSERRYWVMLLLCVVVLPYSDLYCQPKGRIGRCYVYVVMDLQ